jgi:pyruvate-formate lyase-activating enzyme
MRNFDQYSVGADYRPAVDAPSPRLLEFEIANTCNLECVMCTGYWSSSIRSHREKLPPLRSPYDQSFVEQLEEFLPMVTGAKFLGGEPFLIERYYDIWERFARLNPSAHLTITTNATNLPGRARSLLERLRVDFAVSLDGFTPATYEAIRKNARFDTVMRNVDYLLDYARRRGTELAIAICPMTYNWREIPALLEFCEGRGLGLYFNTVLKPFEASLAGLPPDELGGVIEYLESFRPSLEGECGPKNRRHWEGLLNQLRGWQRDKLEFARSSAEIEASVLNFARRHRGSTNEGTIPESFERLLPSAVSSLCIARERAKGDRIEFLTLLPRPPIALAEEGEPPTAPELLLAAHLLCSFLEEQERGRELPDSEALADQQRLLWEYVAGRGGSDPEWMVKVGDWLHQRLRNGESAELIPWMRALVDALEFGDDRQRELGEGLHTLRSAGLDDDEYRTLAAYFDSLVERFLPYHPPWRRLDLTLDARVPPLRELAHLRRVLDALYLFHRCYEPTQDHAAFRRRLDGCLAFVVESGKTAAAYRSLGAADPGNVYRALAGASEEEMRTHLESLA